MFECLDFGFERANVKMKMRGRREEGWKEEIHLSLSLPLANKVYHVVTL